MSSHAFRLPAFAFGFLSTLAAGVAAAENLRGVVIAVTTGSTLTVQDADRKQHRVRLAGIDPPEKGQGFHERSRQHLSELTLKKQAQLDCYRVDGSKRRVCRASVNGRDVALAQVQAGLAWHYKRFEKEQTASERAAYSRAEEQARAARIGLWQSEKPVPPWQFRTRK
jgi:endonuclease YncB( thermonuclease family)